MPTLQERLSPVLPRDWQNRRPCMMINELQPHQPHPTVPWPPSSGTPINEFNTEGYISCAFPTLFPTLFPTGAADFVAPQPNVVTIGNYFKHLLMYDDGRFTRHPRFRYFALNTDNMQVRCKLFLHNRSIFRCSSNGIRTKWCNVP